MKYLLKQNKEDKGILCEKVAIDGFDYYVSDEIIKDVRPYKGRWQVEKGTILNKFPTYLTDLSSCRLVIATNNPNIDIPKVVDEIYSHYQEDSFEIAVDGHSSLTVYVAGYKKSQETHPFSEENMIEFIEWCNKEYEFDSRCNQWFHGDGYYSKKELLQIWKEQKPKVIYYNG